MQFPKLVKALPTLAVTLALSSNGAIALGSQSVGTPGAGLSGPGAVGGTGGWIYGPGGSGGAGPTFLVPYYCLPGSEAATDATASFTTTGKNRHSSAILNLAVPANSATNAAFGAVVNNWVAPIAFSTLAFDASSTNPDTVVEIFVAHNNGLDDAGFAKLADLATSPTQSTPDGYTHCVATRANLSELFKDSVAIGPNNVFLHGAIIQFGNPTNARSTNIANVTFNNSTKAASAVLRQAQNNCVFAVQ